MYAPLFLSGERGITYGKHAVDDGSSCVAPLTQSARYSRFIFISLWSVGGYRHP